MERRALARDVAIAETDPLTGARMRAAGLSDLELEVERCHRTAGLLVAVYVDVVGLKRRNDSRGHAAGDALLERVVTTLGQQLRRYDLVIRLGGDEFLCAISGVGLGDAQRRIQAVEKTLAQGADPARITAGFAALEPGESATGLVDRADRDLIERRGGSPGVPASRVE